MAGIDKTYTESYVEYKEFKDWANKQTITFFNGHKENVGDWVWEHEKEDFNNGEISIMNTPTWLDIYLIQNCKSKFVLDRMKNVYDDESYEKFKLINLTAKPPKEYEKNRKIIIKRNKKTKFPLYNRPYGGKNMWWLQCDEKFGYNTETKTWSHREFYYPTNSNTAHIKTIKGVIRHLRKQYLPKGLTFHLIGRYVGEVFTVLIT
jgi:hypothetical protein